MDITPESSIPPASPGHDAGTIANADIGFESRRENEEPGIEKSTLAWFDSWPVRRGVWLSLYTNWNGYCRRMTSCTRHDYDNLVSITAGAFARGMEADEDMALIGNKAKGTKTMHRIKDLELRKSYK